MKKLKLQVHLVAAALLLALNALAGAAPVTQPLAPSGRSDRILTPPSAPTPRINGPKIFGVRPGSPFFYSVPVTGDRPMDFIADQQPGVLYSRYTEDDYDTFSNFRPVDLNVKRPNLQNNGSFLRRAWNFRHTAPYPLRMQDVELTMMEGD